MFTSAATIETIPAALSWTVMFLVVTLGAILSETVTRTVVGNDTLPFTSVAVKITELSPILLQLKVDLLKV